MDAGSLRNRRWDDAQPARVIREIICSGFRKRAAFDTFEIASAVASNHRVEVLPHAKDASDFKSGL